ncbi:MAG: type II toxin-antitoxin system death-on-curing family toxin [Acidobacteria bacterium]|nr:type II toxin-antitoxin system death-on-curing family toxin [Acidobacteriota bacterium]MBS1864280.1 type II toxin-antitoxin system death-on-curing family toxin [Acidobacteriota bacterium]
MKEPEWLDSRAIVSFHSQSLSEHGGSSGIRDEGLLESALARPKNQFAYAPKADIAKLAAAYGFGLAKNHPFVDGNKRIAFIATATFLRLNGCRLNSNRMEEIQTMLAVAAGKLSEDEFAAWIRLHSDCEG